MPQGDGTGGGQWNLKQLVEEWSRLDSQIDELVARIKELQGGDMTMNAGELGELQAELETLKPQRRSFADRVVNRIEADPSKWGRAVELGFPSSILSDRADVSNPDGTPGGTENSSGSTSGTTGDGDAIIDTPGDKNKKNNNNDGGGPNHNLLPGVNGKDYVVKKGANGKYYVVYDTPVPGTGNSINFMYEIAEKDLRSGAYGIGMNDVAKNTLTRQEIRAKGNFYNFGNVDEIKRGKGGNKHPFSKFLGLLVEQHPNASWMNSKEVMRIMLQAKTEGRGSEWTNNMLRQTKWWNDLSDSERAWEETGDAQKDKVRAEQGVLLQSSLDQAFGPNVKWQDYVSDDKLARWTEAVASGRTSVSVIGDKILSLAEKIEGTAAFTQVGEEGRGLQDSLSDYDTAFGYVRDKAIEWLGYHGKPDQEWVEKMTRQVMSGSIGEAELINDLRGKKQAMFKYLAPDETWMSRAASYKSVFEQLTGTTIGYDDSVLRDFTARKPDGTTTPDVAMSLDEYERYIKRTDNRWRTSDNFIDSRQGLVNLIQQTFTGVGGGF